MITVSIISPRVSMTAIDDVIEKESFGCIFLKYVYDRQEDIEDIYRQCKDKCDVICFSGEIGYHYAINHIRDLTIPCTFIFYNETHVLSMLLNFLIQHPGIPLNRVYIDFLTPGNQYMNLGKYLPPEQMPFCYDRVEYNYARMLQQPKELFEQGKIDFILTRCTNNLQAIRALGIPFQHFLPTEEMIAEAIHGAIDRQKLVLGAQVYQILLFIRLILPEEMSGYDREYYNVTLQKDLVDFRRGNEFDFTIEPGADRFELHAQRTLERDKLHLAKDLVTYLSRNRDFEFRVGVGIGNSVDAARYSAEIALHEAVKYGKNDGFLMEDADDPVLTGPLSAPTTLSYSYSNYKVEGYSRQSGIDERNLLRIMGLFELDSSAMITSAGLSDWLNITVRSCNRILSQLLDSGLIEELQPVKKEGRGRPVRQYQFHTDVCRKTFY